jgi:putative ABC transport system permease protein
MVAQTYHLINAPLGYNTTNIIDIPTSNFRDREEMSVFANEVKQLAAVKRVGFSQGTPFNRGNNNTMEYKGKSISFQILGGDTACFEMLGLQILKENHLGSTNINHCYFSQQAMKETELSEDATEMKFDENWSIQIDGIIKDIQCKHSGNYTTPGVFIQ